MALPDFLAELDTILREAEESFAAAADEAALEAARIEFTGVKSGRLKAAQKGLGTVDKADKPVAGKRFNEVKTQVEALFESATARLAEQQSGESSAEMFDVTLPGSRRRLGRIHPITQTFRELMDIMGRLGFTAAEGPEIEDEWHNFIALNIPESHPARDPLDNFYLSTASRGETGRLLRSQTSTVQIRVMEQTPPPVRIISLGRVYRPDEVDATHYPMFHQMEGLMVDRGVTMGDLKSVMRLLWSSYLGEDVHVRFRPSFFPFTEPSVEVDISWHGKWLELGGAGMVDPNVLQAVGYDPEEVTGFAFGLGVDRLCFMRHGVTDIRDLFTNNVRFLEQF